MHFLLSSGQNAPPKADRAWPQMPQFALRILFQ
jgi:hypothetical protein